jgi:hypothetical protein
MTMTMMMMTKENRPPDLLIGDRYHGYGYISLFLSFCSRQTNRPNRQTDKSKAKTKTLVGETKNQKQNLRDADGDLVFSHKPPARKKKTTPLDRDGTPQEKVDNKRRETPPLVCVM